MPIPPQITNATLLKKTSAHHVHVDDKGRELLEVLKKALGFSDIGFAEQGRAKSTP